MKLLLLLSVLLIKSEAFSSCLTGGEGNLDLLKNLIENAKDCPASVAHLKGLIQEDSLRRIPALVANRGRNNPKLGSFSIFESVEGFSKGLQKDILPEHFYFGHFTDLVDGQVVLDQKPSPRKLLVEVMAYDFKKGIYNFYELVGTQSGTGWFYRGDSRDALLDNQSLKLKDKPEFGQRMRCSGCHASGGPIMKEITFPYNDWWRESRKLIFGKNALSTELESYMTTFIDAREFSTNVRKGMNLLSKSSLSPGSMKEKLRPLFCSTEINLYSDEKSFSETDHLVSVPSEIFVDPLFVKGKKLKLSKAFYLSALRKLGSQFPETSLIDADHAYLAPGRSVSNTLEVKKLMGKGIVDEEFVLDVLSVDFKRPLFSSERCDLLKLVPENPDWKKGFLANLQRKKLSALLRTFTVPNKDEHRKIALQYLEEKEKSWESEEAVVREVKGLGALRDSVFKDEISMNPKGQILEPGFRVIFPKL